LSNLKPLKSRGRHKAFNEKEIERINHMRWVEDLRCGEIAKITGYTASTIQRYTRKEK
jgi:hypothetical protein